MVVKGEVEAGEVKVAEVEAGEVEVAVNNLLVLHQC